MHFATTSDILASLCDSMESDTQQAAHLFELLVYQPDPEDFEHGLGDSIDESKSGKVEK